MSPSRRFRIPIASLADLDRWFVGCEATDMERVNVEGQACMPLVLCCDFSFTKIANFGQMAICSSSF